MGHPSLIADGESRVQCRYLPSQNRLDAYKLRRKSGAWGVRAKNSDRPNREFFRTLLRRGQLGGIPTAAQSLDELHAGGKLTGIDIRGRALVG
jgi:hypothetical protein